MKGAGLLDKSRVDKLTLSHLGELVEVKAVGDLSEVGSFLLSGDSMLFDNSIEVAVELVLGVLVVLLLALDADLLGQGTGAVLGSVQVRVSL